MISEDDGYTGAARTPGARAGRDLAAEGRIDTVLAHAPDRLSRRYPYQVLIIEELARQGVETVFLRARRLKPRKIICSQFQGMVAEYERAQILERSRRGKRHRARRGERALRPRRCGYGYRYHKKTPGSDAFYEIIEPQASVVREVYRYYDLRSHEHRRDHLQAQRTRGTHLHRALALGTLDVGERSATRRTRPKPVPRQDPIRSPRNV